MTGCTCSSLDSRWQSLAVVGSCGALPRPIALKVSILSASLGGKTAPLYTSTVGRRLGPAPGCPAVTPNRSMAPTLLELALTSAVLVSCCNSEKSDGAL